MEKCRPLVVLGARAQIPETQKILLVRSSEPSDADLHLSAGGDPPCIRLMNINCPRGMYGVVNDPYCRQVLNVPLHMVDVVTGVLNSTLSQGFGDFPVSPSRSDTM